MEIKRSLSNVVGDLTVSDGDVIIETVGKGLVAPDQNDVDRRIKPYDDGGALTVAVENK